AEIEHKPPLFPWETEVCEYFDSATPDVVPAYFWTTQLQNLSLPIPMPETILANLLEQCQEVVQTSLREGAKLVQAVESLFPGQSNALNQLAGLVLASPSRSVAVASQPSRFQEGFPSDYDVATPAQRMALSLIAAREIIESLTLTISPSQTQAERQWQTAAGTLTLMADYQIATGRLRVQGELPCPGSLQFQGADAERSPSGLTPAASASKFLTQNPVKPIVWKFVWKGQICLRWFLLFDSSPKRSSASEGSGYRV
ncbi:MAG: hypothetical protein HC899_14710, partial [Leptolyngbyaceae cyanobacterium SM1_4_3]|nr:hypothetical protein [Leptolyngbyaceae cyanobacterium SM1_4_3]